MSKCMDKKFSEWNILTMYQNYLVRYGCHVIKMLAVLTQTNLLALSGALYKTKRLCWSGTFWDSLATPEDLFVHNWLTDSFMVSQITSSVLSLLPNSHSTRLNIIHSVIHSFNYPLMTSSQINHAFLFHRVLKILTACRMLKIFDSSLPNRTWDPGLSKSVHFGSRWPVEAVLYKCSQNLQLGNFMFYWIFLYICIEIHQKWIKTI